MKTSTLADLYTATAVTALLILTAWGNALAMFAVAALAVVAGLLIFGKSFARRGVWAAAVACIVAAVIAVIMQQR